MSMETEADGYEDVENFGKAMTSTMSKRHGKYLETAVQEVLAEAKSNLQNNRNVSTGDLLSSIGILDVSDDGLEITLGSMETYAKYIEFGRGPVDPKNAKVLSWIDKDTGKRVFAKHAGPYEPHPFFEPAVISKMKRYPEIVIQNETEYVQELT